MLLYSSSFENPDNIFAHNNNALRKIFPCIKAAGGLFLVYKASLIDLSKKKCNAFTFFTSKLRSDEPKIRPWKVRKKFKFTDDNDDFHKK